MAGLANLSALLPTIGIIASIIIWATQKDKSRFVYFQALQAIAYQITMIVFFLLGMGCYMLSFFGNFISIFLGATSNSTVRLMGMTGFIIPFLVFGLIFLGWFVFIIYAIIAAIMVFQGKNFRYIIIGHMVQRFVDKK